MEIWATSAGRQMGKAKLPADLGRGIRGAALQTAAVDEYECPGPRV